MENLGIDLRREWLHQLNESDCKYFVLKAEDVFRLCPTQQLLDLNDLLGTYNDGREHRGKTINKYFVVNREDYPQFESAKEFIDFINSAIKNYKPC